MKVIAVVLIVSLLFGFCCAEERLQVVTTDFPCYDFARQVTNGLCEVSMLLKPGAEAHAYEPTPADIIAIRDADLFIYIGGESDVWVEEILSGFDGDEGPVCLKLIDCVDDLLAEENEEGAEEIGYDEHIWTSPGNAIRMVSAVGESLAALDSDHEPQYRAAADRYIAEIGEIDAFVKETVESAARREIIFADRFPFAYFTAAYGLKAYAALPSCSGETEASAQTIMDLIRRVREDGIPAVFTIEMSTQAIARTISEETGAEILTMQSMQTITQDDFDAGKTYVSMMRENAEALEKGLN